LRILNSVILNLNLIPYNYEFAFIDMLDQAILKRIDIYFESNDGILKNYEFIINMDGNIPITYDLNEIFLDNEIDNKLIQKGVLVKGIYPNFIPESLETGFRELLTIAAYLGNINENSIKYVPALRNIANMADILESFKENIIFDGKTKLIDAFKMWTNEILNAQFIVNTEDNIRKILLL